MTDRGRKSSHSTADATCGVTVALTAGLLVWLSPQAAMSYSAAADPAAQLRILRAALANGSAAPMADHRSTVEMSQLAHCDATPSPRCDK
jgi:hypothetical protein